MCGDATARVCVWVLSGGFMGDRWRRGEGGCGAVSVSAACDVWGSCWASVAVVVRGA